MNKSLKHTPKTEEEVLGLIQPGEYEAFIRLIEIKTSKKTGVEYFVATVDVYEANGKPTTVITWLAMDYMIKHLYDACGKSEEYNKEELFPDTCKGCLVTAKVSNSKGDEKYRPSNIITDFYPLKGKETADTFDDDIKF